MSVQTELTRISTAKTNIKNVVNSNTANTITNQKLDAFPPLINSTITAQKGYIPWIKGEGNNFILKNSKSGELDEFEIYGNTEQTTYTGKNYAIITPRDISNYGLTITYDSNTGKISIKGKANSTSGIGVSTSSDLNIPSGEYTLSINKALPCLINYVVTDTTNTNRAFRIPAGSTNVTVNIPYDGISSGLFVAIENNVDYDLEFYLQLETGSTPTSYEPYVGGTASPNPDYPQDVKVVKGNNTINVHGKNLCSSAENFSGGAVYLYFDPKKINKTVTISLISDVDAENSNIFLFGGNTNLGNLGSSNRINLVANQKAYATITIPNSIYEQLSNYDTANFSLYKSGAGHDTNKVPLEAQIENNLSYTSYQPYQEQIYPIALHGKNLFDGEYEIGGYNINTGIKETNTWMYRSVNSISVKPNTQYQFSINGTTIPETPRYFFYDINKNKLSSIVTSGSFTTPDNCYYLTWHSSALKADYPNGLSKTQIEEGGAATAYEPYYNYELCKIGDYKDSIKKSTGKNLLNSEIEEGAYYPATGAKKEESGAYRNATPILVKPNTNYRFSIKGTGYAINVYEYDKDNNYIGYLNNNAVAANSSFTTSQNTKYINIHRGSSGGNQQWQLEENPTVTEYEPYGKVWYKKGYIDKVILDGSNVAFTQKSSSSANTIWMTATDYSNNFEILSNYFVGYTSAYPYNNDVVGIYLENNRIKCAFGLNSDLTTLQAANNWLSTHNTITYYALNTPIITEITNETLINQLNAIETFEGINNISIENENNVLPDILMITKNKDSYNNWKTKEGLN